MEQGQDLRLLALNPVKPISNTALNKRGARTRPCRTRSARDPLEIFTNTLQADGKTIYTTNCKVGPVRFMLTN